MRIVSPPNSGVSERARYRDGLLDPTFDVLAEQPAFQDGGLDADVDAIVVFWKGEFGTDARAALAEANARGVVVRVVWVPYSYQELREIAGRLVDALGARDIEIEGYATGDPFDTITVWARTLDKSSETRRIAEDTAAEVLPPDMDFVITTSAGRLVSLDSLQIDGGQATVQQRSSLD